MIICIVARLSIVLLGASSASTNDPHELRLFSKLVNFVYENFNLNGSKYNF